jgi:peptidyl-prolyl cis-trans isomerase C
MRLSLAIAAALLCTPAAMAQTPSAQPSTTQPSTTQPSTSQKPSVVPPAASTAPTAAQPSADPVVAKVNNRELHLSDVSEAAQTLPDEVRSMPPQVLYPMLLDQMVDREALVIEAEKEGLEKDPQVQRAIGRATDTVLQNAILSRDIAPTVTDAAIHAKYDADYAKKPGEEEVHAMHILVDNEDQAKKIIDQLNHGGDFAALAKANSKDPGAQNGGDLGYFKKTDMVPEFANAAFALKPGQVTQTPVHTQFGWHVIKVIDTRTAPPPTFDQAKDEIRQQIIQAGVRKALDQARQGLTIQKFNMDGTPMTADAASATVPPNPTSTPTTDLPPTPGTTPAVPK